MTSNPSEGANFIFCVELIVEVKRNLVIQTAPLCVFLVGPIHNCNSCAKEWVRPVTVLPATSLPEAQKKRKESLYCHCKLHTCYSDSFVGHNSNMSRNIIICFLFGLYFVDYIGVCIILQSSIAIAIHTPFPFFDSPALGIVTPSLLDIPVVPRGRAGQHHGLPPLQFPPPHRPFTGLG